MIDIFLSTRAPTNLDLIIIVFLGVLLAGLFKEVVGWGLDIITDWWKFRIRGYWWKFWKREHWLTRRPR